MSVRVVRAEAEDWQRYRSMRLAALTDSPDAFGTTLVEEQGQPPQWWRDRLAAWPATTLLAVVDDEDVGLCRVGASYDTPDVAGLYSMWVAPHVRGQGAGDALLVNALEVARDLGWSSIVLEVGDSNGPAIELYRRHGFTPTGTTTHLAAPRQHITESEYARLLR